MRSSGPLVIISTGPAISTNRVQRTFSTFPGGLPGLGLLLLRCELGAATIIQGSHYFMDTASMSGSRVVLATLLIASGVSILLGFLTPISGLLVLAGGIVSLIVAFPIFTGPFSSTVTSPFLLSATLILLGPGAVSIDSAIFGRREIVIPKD